MKNRIIQNALISLLVLTSCSTEKDCDDPIDCLPPLTETGANTAGCLVEGNLLLPTGQSLNSGSVLKAQYNKADNNADNFSIAIRDLKGTRKSIFIEMGGIELRQNETYVLKENDSGVYAAFLTGNLTAYSTSNESIGEIFISYFDESKRIISGTFWFDGRNKQGEIVKVRQGRFDVTYY